MTLATQIGARLRQLRKTAQLTQEELAERAGLSTSMVSMTERGERLPTLETLGALALGICRDYDYVWPVLSAFFSVDTEDGT